MHRKCHPALASPGPCPLRRGPGKLLAPSSVREPALAGGQGHSVRVLRRGRAAPTRASCLGFWEGRRGTKNRTWDQVFMSVAQGRRSASSPTCHPERAKAIFIRQCNYKRMTWQLPFNTGKTTNALVKVQTSLCFMQQCLPVPLFHLADSPVPLPHRGPWRELPNSRLSPRDSPPGACAAGSHPALGRGGPAPSLPSRVASGELLSSVVYEMGFTFALLCSGTLTLVSVFCYCKFLFL